MAKPDLGTKRLCAGCGAKFYDLNRTPIVCPKCETEFVPVVVAPRTRPDTPKPAPVVATTEAVVPETADAEFVSLEDAETEEQGGKKGAAAEAEEGEDLEDAAFIEEQEEAGNADVSDIIGEGVEKEEEQ